MRETLVTRLEPCQIIKVCRTEARVPVSEAVVRRSDCVEQSTVVRLLTAPPLRFHVVLLVQLSVVERMVRQSRTGSHCRRSQQLTRGVVTTFLHTHTHTHTQFMSTVYQWKELTP